MIDTLYTNGVIAVKEKSLLGDRIFRLCELSPQDAFRALVESGFGGAEGSASDSELLCSAEEAALDGFIREYAPSERELNYLLAPRDFHNAKALVKAKKLGGDPEKLLAPEGLCPISALKAALEGDRGELNGALFGAITRALEEELTGAQIGALFDRACYEYLFSVCGRGVLRKMLIFKADMNNLLTALRASDPEFARELFLPGGKLSAEDLLSDSEGGEPQKRYPEFWALCREAAAQGAPFTDAENALDSFESDYFYERRFELKNKEPFLYYVFRRRAEIANVRIVLVCLNAGLKEREIVRRLRGRN